MLVNVRVFKGKYKYAVTAKRDNVILLTVTFILISQGSQISHET